jgi:hypothetical protein
MNPEENKPDAPEEPKKDPRDEVDTVVSKNDNMEPVPDKEQLEEKKEPEE